MIESSDIMQVYKVSDIKFQSILTKKVLDDLSEYYTEEKKTEILSNISKYVYFTVADSYGYQGFIALDQKEDSLEIKALGVLKASMRRKLGSALIKAAKDYAKVNNKKLVSINIKDDSSKDVNYLKTRRFLSKLGFINITVIESCEGPILVMGYIL